MSERPVVVLGVTGMLGHKVFQHLSGQFPNVLGTCRGSGDCGAISRGGAFARRARAAGGGRAVVGCARRVAGAVAAGVRL